MELTRTLLAAGAVAVLALTGTARADGDVQAGKAKAGACAGCHGASGEGVGTNPPLAAMKKNVFEQAMKDYQSGKRANAIMKPIASGLSAKEVEDLAAYYGSLKGK